MRDALGEDLYNKVIRSYKFHFMQSVQKVAQLVTETNNQHSTFIAMGRLIFETEEDDAGRMFSVIKAKLICKNLFIFFKTIRRVK